MRSKSRVERWNRIERVMELTSKGWGPYEIARELQVDAHTIYSDLELYAKMYAFMMRPSLRAPQIFVKTEAILRRAWKELHKLDTDPESNVRDVSPLLAQANTAVATQARVLGVDEDAKAAEAVPVLTIVVAGGGGAKEIVHISQPAQVLPAVEMPEFPKILVAPATNGMPSTHGTPP